MDNNTETTILSDSQTSQKLSMAEKVEAVKEEAEGLIERIQELNVCVITVETQDSLVPNVRFFAQKNKG